MNDIDRRLLGFVMHNPRRTLVLGIATGFAVALELCKRGELGALASLGADRALCEQAAERVLRCWVECDRAGGIEAVTFGRLCDTIIGSTKAS